MVDFPDWFAVILGILIFILPQALSFLLFAVTIALAIWTVRDVFSFMGASGVLNRGMKISGTPLTNDQIYYIQRLSANIFDRRDGKANGEVTAFLLKQNAEVLINVQGLKGMYRRKSWPFIGYVDLSAPEPLLEIRSSLPFHLFLACLSLSIVLLPFVAGIWLVSFNVEKAAIRKYLQDKVDETLYRKEIDDPSSFSS